MGKPPGIFSEDLKRLINGLLAFSPKDRPSIAEIKALMWFNEEDLKPEEVRAELAKRRAKVEVNWKVKATEALAKKEATKKNKGAIGGFAPHGATMTRAAISADKGVKAGAAKVLPQYEECEGELTKVFTVEEPEEVLKRLREYFDEQKFEVKESAKKFKIQAHCTTNEAEVLLNVRVERADENVRCVRVEKVCGARMEFLTIFNEITNFLAEAQMLIR
eukprot:TRINITY_DN0_c529_g1_i2.p1 TRINITY_DN0_c529_g1~~TRINITY_DN0_c529_g1_i2.p1  ORF type:complete len:219 (-),score=90.41 TRINITY_DN0_c529_g1_i2:37-693(-)